jgi:hypothetical protein
MTVICGPYIGGLEQEIFSFHPHVAWLYRVLIDRCDYFYVFSHENHSFFYDWPGVNFVSVDGCYSVESNHSGIVNKLVSSKEYLSLIKFVRNKVSDKDVLHYNIRYTIYDNFVVPLHKKMFVKINMNIEKTDNIVLISRGHTDFNVVKKIKDRFVGHDLIEIDDKWNHYDAIKTIQSAIFVICQCGPWTYFCNLHKVPVVSWGNVGYSMYKDNGVYNFKNICITTPNEHNLFSSIEYMLERV